MSMHRHRLLGVGLLGVGVLMFEPVAGATELRAPQNVHGAPGSPQSAELATRAAVAQMKGHPEEALALAEQGIKADANDPWPYYNKAMALAELGQVDAAAAAFVEAERRFLSGDLWGKSIALYGRGHAYAQAGRCSDAQKAFDAYVRLVGGYQPDSADMIRRYEDECRASLLRQPAASPSSAVPEPAR
jgi:tetratricopeptide (TPR) repeat protein